MTRNGLASSQTLPADRADKFGALREALLGEERPRDMYILLFLLVLALHAWLLAWMLRPDDVRRQPPPLIMQVSMVAMQAARPSAAPPTPAPPQPQKPVPPKPVPKKPEPKPLPRKTPPVEQKPQDVRPAEKPAEQAAPQPVTSAAPTSNVPVAAAQETFTEANFRANYLHNPKPEYPSVAKSRGWEGKVTLKVRVSASGGVESAEIEHSSGHEMLDESALETVKEQWRFVPAKRGDTPVAATVLVPILFHLSED